MIFSISISFHNYKIPLANSNWGYIRVTTVTYRCFSCNKPSDPWWYTYCLVTFDDFRHFVEVIFRCFRWSPWLKAFFPPNSYSLHSPRDGFSETNEFFVAVKVHRGSGKFMTYDICSMYGIYFSIYHECKRSVGKYSIHGASGYDIVSYIACNTWVVTPEPTTT